MTINEYQQLAMRTARSEYGADKLLNNGAMGLCGEAGEVADIVKKYLFHDHALDKAKLAEELGDVAWYLAITAYSQGLKLEDVLRGNIDKLMKRYPDGFSAERSVNRPEYTMLMRSDLDAFGQTYPQLRVMLDAADIVHKPEEGLTALVYDEEDAVWAKLISMRLYSIQNFIKAHRGIDVTLGVEVRGTDAV